MLTETAAEQAPGTETQAEAKPLSILDSLKAYEAGETELTPKEAPAAEVETETVEAEEGEELPAEDTAEEAEVVEEEEAAEEEEEELKDGEPYTLKLPGRREGDPDVDVVIEGLDAQTQQRLNQLKNGFMRGEEYRQAMGVAEQRFQELSEISEALSTDPGSFFREKVDPSLRVEAAISILDSLLDEDGNATPEYERVVETLNQWAHEPEARVAMREDVEIQKELRAIDKVVNAHIPEGADQGEVMQFRQAVFGLLQNHVTQHGPVYADQVPALIEKIARGYGYKTPVSGTRAGAAAPASSPATGPTKEQIAAAKDTGKRLVQASARRKEVSSVAPAGLGAATHSGSPPSGQSIEDRLDWFLKQ